MTQNPQTPDLTITHPLAAGGVRQHHEVIGGQKPMMFQRANYSDIAIGEFDV